MHTVTAANFTIYQNTECGIFAFKVTKYKVTYIQHSLEISCESLCKYLRPFGSYL